VALRSQRPHIDGGEVQCDRAIPLLAGKIFGRHLQWRATGVVDPNRDLAKLRNSCLRQRLDGIVIGDIGGDGKRPTAGCVDFGRYLVDLMGAASRHNDRSATIDEGMGDALANTAATTGDHGHVVGHIEQLRHTSCP
jgi:hypothetical protein